MKHLPQITDLTLKTSIFIGPPGVGKTTFKQKHPRRFIDPEDSINWGKVGSNHGLYPFRKFRTTAKAKYEHEVDWSAVWTEEILPRLFLGITLQKDIIMGLVTPLNIEAVSRFLSAFRGKAKLILPSEEKHYGWTLRDVEKRPKTWGSEFRTWKNTYWIRLLLRGLAEELGMSIVGEPTCHSEKNKQKENFANRKAVGEKGTVFAEMFFGRWAKLDVQEEIVAIYREVATSSGIIKIKCDKTAKGCGKGVHDCETLVHLQNDIEGKPLVTWIARDKIQTPRKDKNNAVIFFVGTLAPFHHGHLDLLNTAKAYLESEGWNVVAGYAATFKKRKEERLGTLHSMLGPVDRRNAMLQLGVMHSEWLMADFPIEHVLRTPLLKKGAHPAQLVVPRLRKGGVGDSKTPVTTFWVNGSDGYLDNDFFRQFAKYANMDSLNPLRMLIVENRPGKNMWSKKNITENVPALAHFVSRCRQHMKNPTSATAVRNALLEGDRVALKASVGLPLVESYLLGIVHKYVLWK